MITLRKSAERGFADHGWLKSHHSFSFADYHDPAHMGVGNLRVINDDRIAPGTGFGTHGHRDMEIVSYVLDGALAHKDSMGNGSGPAERQIKRRHPPRRRAAHERRHRRAAQRVQPRAPSQTTHFLQIWILPQPARHRTPGYEQKHFDAAESKRGRLAPGGIARRPRGLGDHPRRRHASAPACSTVPSVSSWP